MPLSPREREEVVAVRDATTLHMLPNEANIASQKWLAGRLIDTDNEVRRLRSRVDELEEAIEEGGL